MSSRGKFRPPTGAQMMRRLGLDKLREVLYDVAKWSPRQVESTTFNRMARRRLARAQRQHGRGFTKPLHGPGHTRGSGYHT